MTSVRTTKSRAGARRLDRKSQSGGSLGSTGKLDREKTYETSFIARENYALMGMEAGQDLAERDNKKNRGKDD